MLGVIIVAARLSFMLTLVTSAPFLACFAKKWTYDATVLLIAIILLVVIV
jgi:hypothetical protein